MSRSTVFRGAKGALGYVLMYGAFGLPGQGARGSGLANVLVWWPAAAGYLALVRFAPCYPGPSRRRGRRRLDPAIMPMLLRLGLPMAGSVLMEVSMFSVAGLMIGGLGEDAVASHQVALNLASVSFMVPPGVALATTVRVGNAVGRGDAAGMRRASLAGIGLAVPAQTGSAALMFGIPLGWWLGLHGALGARGVWMGLIAGLATAAALLLLRFDLLSRRLPAQCAASART